jgi:5-hydroxyisourate hydrolase
MTRRHSISTHVLDTERGEPAVGVSVILSRRDGDRLTPVAERETDRDGRIGDLLDGALVAGSYQLVFEAAAYFQAREPRAEPAFLSRVTLEFEIRDVGRHYHVPLLLSRYSCTTYRGS